MWIASSRAVLPVLFLPAIKLTRANGLSKIPLKQRKFLTVKFCHMTDLTCRRESLGASRHIVYCRSRNGAVNHWAESLHQIRLVSVPVSFVRSLVRLR